MPQYKYREYTISISTMRVDDAIKVDTDIFLSPDAATGFGNRLRAGTPNSYQSPRLMMSTKQPLTRRRLRSTSTSLRNLLCQRHADAARRKMASTCRGVACCETGS